MKTHFKKGMRGWGFKNGKLYRFEDVSVLVMSGWPKPRAWFKNNKSDWHLVRKQADAIFDQEFFTPDHSDVPKPQVPFTLDDGQMILPGVRVPEETFAYAVYFKYHALSQYFNLIPADVRKELMTYNSRIWHLMNLFARCPGAMDLSHSNPGLCFALASNWVFRKPAVSRPLRAARALVWKKQKDILGWLGFPATESARRILAKIDKKGIDIQGLFFLRDAMKDQEAMKLLSFLPVLTKGTLMSVSNRNTRPHVTPKLLEDMTVAVEGNGVYAYDILRDTMRMADLVHWEKCPRRFSSLARLREVHDELSVNIDLARIGREHNLPERFNTPPFEGTDDIVPLMTPEEVVREGREQSHCAGSYVVAVAQGMEFIYKVLNPVRATLSVTYENGAWQPGQLYKACNEPVDGEIRGRLFRTLFKTSTEAYSQAG